jgi:hypothetical protein
VAASEPAKRKHRINAAGRRAIAAALRWRWAEQKAAAGTSAAKLKKRKLSPAGRAAIVAALKKRRAAKREGEKAGRVTAKDARAKADDQTRPIADAAADVARRLHSPRYYLRVLHRFGVEMPL